MAKRRASESDDSLAAKPVKKSKTDVGKGVGGATAPKVTADGDEYWEIPEGGKRRVVLSSFRNTPMVSVREYYTDNSGGDMKPGKKGISLTVPQFAALVEALPAIERSLKKRGHDIPRPDYGGGSGDQKDGDGGDEDGADDEDVEIKDDDGGDEDDEDDHMDKRPSASKASKKREKSRKNFEETSDEDED